MSDCLLLTLHYWLQRNHMECVEHGVYAWTWCGITETAAEVQPLLLKEIPIESNTMYVYYKNQGLCPSSVLLLSVVMVCQYSSNKQHLKASPDKPDNKKHGGINTAPSTWSGFLVSPSTICPTCQTVTLWDGSWPNPQCQYLTSWEREAKINSCTNSTLNKE